MGEWRRGKGFWRSFAAICIPLLLSALEGSVTNTALPTISQDLNIGTSFSWVATAFLLTGTIVNPLFSQLADLWGRKAPFIVAVVIFAIGSALCGFAKNFGVLIAGRAIQGIGTGGIDILAELILCDLIPLRQRGLYTAIKNAVFAIGTCIGPPLGGYFAECNWRWVFWINIPVCVLAVMLLVFWLQVSSGSKNRAMSKDKTMMVTTIDLLGTGLLAVSVIMFLWVLSFRGATYSWNDARLFAALVIGALSFIGFTVWELFGCCTQPILPRRVFNNRTSVAAFIITGIHGFVTYGVQFFLPTYFQAVKRSKPKMSGIQVLPTTLVIVVLAAVGGPLMAKFGKYRPIHQGGFLLIATGSGCLVSLSKNTPIVEWVLFQIIFGSGSGIVVPTTLAAIQAALPDSDHAASAGAWSCIRGLGSLFGVAIPSAIFNAKFVSLLHTIENKKARNFLDGGQAYQYAGIDLWASPVVKDEILNVYQQSLMLVWITYLLFAIIGLLISFFEKTLKLRGQLDTAYGLKSEKKANPSGNSGAGV